MIMIMSPQKVERHKEKQGRSSSIGAKNLSFVLRQLTEDFKEENIEKESVQYSNEAL